MNTMHVLKAGRSGAQGPLLAEDDVRSLEDAEQRLEGRARARFKALSQGVRAGSAEGIHAHPNA